jgi:hypothetical protein
MSTVARIVHLRRPALFLSFLFLCLCGRSQNSLSREEAIQDIDYYIQTMRASHYDPYMRITKEEYDKQVEGIKKKLKDSTSIKELVLIFFRITALLQDAHSTPQLVQPVFQEEFRKEQFFPFRLSHHKGRLYVPTVSSAAMKIPAGAEILSINGIGIPGLLADLQSRIAGTVPFRSEISCRMLSYFLFLKEVRPPFIVMYRDKGKTSQTTIEKGTPIREALTATLPHIRQHYVSEILQNKTGYIDIRTLSTDTGKFRQFLDSSFRRFRQEEIRQLAIDLRQNSGGNTDLGDLLFSYFEHPSYSWGKKSWRISEVYKANLRANGDSSSPYLQKKDGSIWESDTDCLPVKAPFRQDGLFRGKVYFITGPFTFSSAMAVADVVKEYRLGTLIGEPTGENRQDFGEAFTITLPNSRIRIQSTTSFSHGANCRNNRNDPVIPDIIIEDRLEDKILGRDRVLQYLESVSSRSHSRE